MIIYATRKLAARLPKVSKEPIEEVSALGNWHADRLTLDRRQCVLFCHDETRAALFIAGSITGAGGVARVNGVADLALLLAPRAGCRPFPIEGFTALDR
jgi:uncharacterized protein DUF6933